jgi:hypothetical protein
MPKRPNCLSVRDAVWSRFEFPLSKCRVEMNTQTQRAGFRQQRRIVVTGCLTWSQRRRLPFSLAAGSGLNEIARFGVGDASHNRARKKRRPFVVGPGLRGGRWPEAHVERDGERCYCGRGWVLPAQTALRQRLLWAGPLTLSSFSTSCTRRPCWRFAGRNDFYPNESGKIGPQTRTLWIPPK